MHEGGDTPPASTIPPPYKFRPDGDSFFLPKDHEQFLPTIVVRPAASGEANSFCSAF